MTIGSVKGRTIVTNVPVVYASCGKTPKNAKVTGSGNLVVTVSGSGTYSVSRATGNGPPETGGGQWTANRISTF